MVKISDHCIAKIAVEECGEKEVVFGRARFSPPPPPLTCDSSRRVGMPPKQQTICGARMQLVRQSKLLKSRKLQSSLYDSLYSQMELDKQIRDDDEYQIEKLKLEKQIEYRMLAASNEWPDEMMRGGEGVKMMKEFKEHVETMKKEKVDGKAEKEAEKETEKKAKKQAEKEMDGKAEKKAKRAKKAAERAAEGGSKK